MEDLCSNIYIYIYIWFSLRILLTKPIFVASGESFSKLELIKTCLRSSVSQENSSSLAALSSENTIAQNLDFSKLVKTFAHMKVRKVNFY
jgi:hypothetical protein